MSHENQLTGLQLRSMVRTNGELEVSLADIEFASPGNDEVLIRMEAAPLNPSDLSLLLGLADPKTLRSAGTSERPTLVATVPPQILPALEARFDQSLPVGNEGAGTVIAAGANAREWLGQTVAVFGGATYAQYRTAAVADCMVLPPGSTPADGASWFVNPLTALGLVETMRRKGHSALVHTAAASNLGQMLNRICLADGIDLVNVVRSPAQVELLRAQGAKFVCDTSSSRFAEDLAEALAATRATLAFDALGGGTLAGDILAGMEVALRKGAPYSLYGTPTKKQVYIYGALNLAATNVVRRFGFAWGIGGWLLPTFLEKVGPETVRRLKARVANELTSTFASTYAGEITLDDLLKPDVILQCATRATGQKYLIVPNPPAAPLRR
jgi:NADPH2:quinone reductase